jgi:hypothetical protein
VAGYSAKGAKIPGLPREKAREVYRVFFQARPMRQVAWVSVK